MLDLKLGRSLEGDLGHSRVRDWRLEVRGDFVVKDKSWTKGDEEKDPSCRVRRGLKRIMLREDYVEDKSIFKLRSIQEFVLLI